MISASLHWECENSRTPLVETWYARVGTRAPCMYVQLTATAVGLGRLQFVSVVTRPLCVGGSVYAVHMQCVRYFLLDVSKFPTSLF